MGHLAKHLPKVFLAAYDEEKEEYTTIVELLEPLESHIKAIMFDTGPNSTIIRGKYISRSLLDDEENGAKCGTDMIIRKLQRESVFDDQYKYYVENYLPEITEALNKRFLDIIIMLQKNPNIIHAFLFWIATWSQANSCLN